MSILHKAKAILFILILLLLSASVVEAKDYIEVWPEGWSEVTSLFKTSIFADRFMVAHDDGGTSFLSVDGLYFRELDLAYRLVRGGVVEEEVILRAKSEIESIFLGLDQSGKRHVVWLEKAPEQNSLNYTNFDVPYRDHEPIPLLVTKHTIQDLAAIHVDDTTHLVWSERDRYFQIKYAQILHGELIVLETVTDSTDLSVRPSVTVDPGGAVHIAWMETSPTGIDILHTKRAKGLWSEPGKIGGGSVQDVQQGGKIGLASYNNDVYATWSELPRNSNRLFVFLARIDDQGRIHPAQPVGYGSKAQFVTGALHPELVWQGVGEFGAQINHVSLQDGGLSETTNLTVGRKGAFRPEGFSSDGFLFVQWLQAETEGGFRLFQINNQFPKPISFWRRVGIDETAPVYHLLFLFISTFMLAIVYTLMNLGVILVGGAIFAFLQRFAPYQNQTLLYRVVLIAAILAMVSRLPIPRGSPGFFGLLHYGLSFALATTGSYLVLRQVKRGGALLNASVFLLWMLLFQFFSLIPQAILR